jgi:hypothetical protein
MSVHGIRPSTSQIQQYKPQEKQPQLPKLPGHTEPPVVPKPAEADKSAGGVLTASEKEYFEGLFPNAKADIRSHNVYRKDGSTPSTSVGTVLDRKG